MKTHRLNHREAFRYLDEQAPVLFFTLSREGMITDANAHAKHLTGRSLVGASFQKVIIDFTGSFDLEAAAENEAEELLVNIETSSGLPQSYYFTFRRVSDHILAFGRLDAEEIEHMRIEVLSMNKMLNNLTRELHKKNAQLKRLNQEKNRFLGMAAHDLRKPIGVILAYNGFLIEEAREHLSDEHYGFLDKIQSSCAFMKQLVDDFLDVSAIDAGKFDLDLQPTNLDNFLPGCLQFNFLQASKKKIQLKVTCNHSISSITIDAPKMQQAISNLVSNAIEHSEPGRTVTVQLSDNGGHLIFSVQDEGSGISPEKLPRLFEPFQTTESKKTAGEKSTGLGLLITRKIITSHNGKIWIDSEVGRGTTVYFKLPIRSENK